MSCDIFHVAYKDTFRWKWRVVDENGRIEQESDASYALYYECVTDARRNGFKPPVRCH